MAKPERVFRCGNIRCTIWPAVTNGPCTCEISKIYWSESAFHTTRQLSPNDTIVATRLLQLAGDYMIAKEATRVATSKKQAKPLAAIAADILDEDNHGEEADRPF